MFGRLLKHLLGLQRGSTRVRRAAGKSRGGAKKTVAKGARREGKRTVSAFQLHKIPENPIIAPRRESEWEGWQTFNPGAIVLEDVVHFLYRAIGKDGISRLGYAASKDGFVIGERLPYPVYEHQVGQMPTQAYCYQSGGSWGGCEDPRVVRVGDEDVVYMTYTACNGDLRVALTSISLEDFLQKRWHWKAPLLISPPEEVHKNWVVFPEKIRGKYAILHSLNPEVLVEYVDSLEFEDHACITSNHGGKPRQNCWDRWIRGVGPVPLKTDYGWLVFYHAMDHDWSKYRVGALLLDRDDPTIVRSRARTPVLEPSEPYEYHGFKPGVVYVSGAVVKDGQLLLYYGAADSYVCVAHADAAQFLDALRKDQEPALTRRVMREKVQ